MAETLQAVFNVTDQAHNFPLEPGGSAEANTTNLNSWVQLLYDPQGPTAGQGGTLLFPVHKEPYPFAGPINIGPTVTEIKPQSIIFAGTGQGWKDKVVLQQTVDSDLFVVENNPGNDESIGGVTFQDMFVEYLVPSTKNPPSSAIRVGGPPMSRSSS